MSSEALTSVNDSQVDTGELARPLIHTLGTNLLPTERIGIGVGANLVFVPFEMYQLVCLVY